ncbi:hypothetical protein ACF0H5_013485 [Mactra antiquata]
METNQPDFQGLLQQHVTNLHSENDKTDNNKEVKEPVEVDVEILEENEDIIGNENELNEPGELDDVNELERPVTGASLNPECLMLCGRILRLMGDEITCKACGKHLQSIGDEIFSSYLMKNSISALLYDLSNRERERYPEHNM